MTNMPSIDIYTDGIILKSETTLKARRSGFKAQNGVDKEPLIPAPSVRRYEQTIFNKPFKKHLKGDLICIMCDLIHRICRLQR